MDVLKGIDLGTYASMRLVGIQNPELFQILHGSAIAGGYLWVFFLAILVYRWRVDLGRFPAMNLLKTLTLIVLVEALRWAFDRPRPDDAQDFFGQVVGGSFPNGPTFRAVLISALMWETTKPGPGRWLGLLGAILYCVWVMLGQLMVHLAFLSDVLASLSLALGIGFLSPWMFDRRVSIRRDVVPKDILKERT